MKTRNEVINRLENLLGVAYENDTFTWVQIKKAFLKATEPYDSDKSMTLQEFDRLHPEFKQSITWATSPKNKEEPEF